MVHPRPGTILRLDPAHQPLWRDATTVQFGLDRRAEVEVSEPWQDALISKLASGIRAERFDVVAHGLGAPRGQARLYLEALRPVLCTARATPPRVYVGSGAGMPVAGMLWTREALSAAGFLLADAEDRLSVAVVAVAGAASARGFAAHLAADRPHLPIAFDAGGTTIGPLVLPGRTPCLSCRDAHEKDRDPAWPLLHAQLIDRDPGQIAPSRIVEAANVAAWLLTTLRPGGVAIRITVDAARSRRRVTFHAECQCRMVRPRSPRGSARAGAPPSPRAEPTTARAYAQPA